ncbi:CDP-alcohol phosphatidyltransferase [Nitzschia inconspicua]|uniref:CDP-alcohol phosphatidyltransferase n=1 Tax=Nitzschia inconspicua TaxID=303405 RepID=A0A9K3LED3_9STRA|nr:CDP-alcohol phosphatidyltransferase [Nitzschia inconspicua]
MTSRTTSSPKDQHKMHVWLIEPTASKNSATTTMDGVLTPDGCEQIAQHKYKAGSYTSLDTFLNPGWTQLTEFLPLWLAPNLVTTIGGCFCLISYVLSVHFLNHQDDNDDSSDNPIPRWLYFWNAFALCAYYTLDCMDGKQARRTNSSSPLGQLFDHGVDALGNPTDCIFSSAVGRVLHGQFAACHRNVGVTEVTYGMALWSLVTGLFGREIYEQRVVTLSDANDSNSVQSLLLWWTGGLHELQVRHVAAIMWVFLIIGLTTLSYIRVYEHVGGDIKVFFSAVSKLALGPWLLSYVGVVINQQSTLALGLAFCLITIKIIVFSMARMAFASLQMAIFPFLTASLWLRYAQHDWLTSGMKQQLEWALDVFYLAAISLWANRAISQLCEKLHIKLFRIDVKKKDS